MLNVTKFQSLTTPTTPKYCNMSKLFLVTLSIFSCCWNGGVDNVKNEKDMKLFVENNINIDNDKKLFTWKV